MGLQYQGTERLYSNGATTSTWSAPTTTSNVFVSIGAASWAEAYRVFVAISHSPLSGTTWRYIITTDKYSPLLPPQSVSITSTPVGLGHRLNFSWTDPTGYGGYSMVIVWNNYDAAARGDSSKAGTVTITPPRGTTATINNVGDTGDHIDIQMYYTDGTGVSGQYTTTVIV